MWDDKLVRDAIMRELNRDGQVYFVHNFVRDIHQIANRLRTLVPEARFVVRAWPDGRRTRWRRSCSSSSITRPTCSSRPTSSSRGSTSRPRTRSSSTGPSVLAWPTCTSSAVESGARSIGAYAYALLAPKHPVKENAARRLKALEHYSDLGAGFQIAMRDLEIRGARDILGAEQSGHIEAVGYEMYLPVARTGRSPDAQMSRPRCTAR